MPENLSIPKHWQLVRVGEYVISVKGKKPKNISSVKTHEFAIPYVNIKAFEKNVIDEYTDGVGCVICEEGDFLMVWDGSRSGYVGKAIKGALGSTLVKLKFPNIDTNYAYYFLQSKYIEINTRAKGVGIPHVDPNLLWNYSLPVPPLQEQTAIVSKIDELLSDLENGKQQLLFTQQQLKVYRQSLLKAAFEGRFGYAQRPPNNLKDGELPNGWKWVILKDITKVISDGDHQAPPKASTGVPFITISNVNKSSNKIDFSNTFKVPQSYYQTLNINRKPLKGDVLFTVTGSFGIPVIIDFDLEFCFQRHIGLVRPLENVNQKWLYYLLQSPLIYSQAEKTATGTAQKTVALSSLRNFDIPYCTLDTQLIIVNELETKLSVCDKIEVTINQSLQQAETLRQSILKKAFEGRLVNYNQIE